MPFEKILIQSFGITDKPIKMEIVENLIKTGAITIEEIEDYLNSIGKEIVDSKVLEDLENISMNHPG